MKQLQDYGAVFELNEISSLFPALSISSISTDKKFTINTDSRFIKPDQIFLPLVGEKFDGHDFINDVLENGIELSFCESAKVNKIQDKINENNKSKLIIVENTLDAYHLLANYYRKKINPKVIAVTGSSGKTTTKELLSAVISVKYKTHKTQANYNNEIGVPKTILEMPQDTEVLILELAMRQEGEIRYLAKTCEPDIAIITNIGAAHIGRLGNIETITKTKCEILEYLKHDGVAVLHNNPILIQYATKIWNGKKFIFALDQASDISFKNGKSNFTFKDLGDMESEQYCINALGNIHVLNSIIAILTTKHLGLSKKEIQEGLLKFNIPNGRGNILKLSEETYLINESYNANPDSVRAAILNLIECWNGKDYKKVLVLGELAELGQEEDKLLNELTMWLKDKSIDVVITVGDRLRQIHFAQNVKNNTECCDILKRLLKPGTIVLVKGSRVAKLDEVIDSLTKSDLLNKK